MPFRVRLVFFLAAPALLWLRICALLCGVGYGEAAVERDDFGRM